MPITYDAIATTTLGSAQSTISFTNCPLIYTDLVLVINAKATAGTIYPFLRFNNDASTNYSRVFMSGRSTNAVVTGRSTSANYADITAYAGVTTTNFNWNSIVQINGYTIYNNHKIIIARSNNGVSGNVDIAIGSWRGGDIIRRIDIICDSSSLTAGSTFTLYGIRAA